MPVIDCGRRDCLYNDTGQCGCDRIALMRGKCTAYITKHDLQGTMSGRSMGVHRESRRYKNNTGKVIR